MARYSLRMVERYCPHCVPVVSGRYPEIFSHEDARIHQDNMQEAVLTWLQDLAVDGLVEHLPHADLAMTIGDSDPDLRPTQTCMSLATTQLYERGFIVRIENYSKGRMRAPNSYELTSMGLSWMGGPLQN